MKVKALLVSSVNKRFNSRAFAKNCRKNIKQNWNNNNEKVGFEKKTNNYKLIKKK